MPPDDLCCLISHQLRGSQNPAGSDQDAGSGLLHPGRKPNRPGLHHHQVQVAQSGCLGVSTAAHFAFFNVSKSKCKSKCKREKKEQYV